MSLTKLSYQHRDYRLADLVEASANVAITKIPTGSYTDTNTNTQCKQ